MNAPASFNKPFFMTRQAANLMEDLQRQISQAGSVCLVHGAEGVGKSRLLEQFSAIRLRQQKVRKIRLNRQGFYVDESHTLQPFEDILSIFPEAPEKDSIWMFDQLEQASTEVYQCLLGYWASYAIGRPVALILSGRSTCLKGLYEASRHNNLPVASVELRPFSKLESHQFLAACLCPDAQSTVKFSDEVKRQIELTGGFPELLNQIVQRYTGLIDCNIIQAGFKRSGLFWSAVVLLLVLGIGAGFLEFKYTEVKQMPQVEFSDNNEPEIAPVTNNPDIEQPTVVASQAQTDIASEPAVDIEHPNHTDSVAEDIAQGVDMQPMNAINVQPSEQTNNLTMVEHGDSRPLEENLLQERLRKTQQWLLQSKNDSASIQIMTLVQRNEIQPGKSLLRFLQKIQRQGVDTNQVYVYQKRRSSSLIYVVLFGSYSDRAVARTQIDTLPAELKANSPLIRTVSGIKAELSNS
jgi:hypothetical protein